MIYFIIGASGSGKTACLPRLQTILKDYTVYDFDDIGVPDNADKKWRQEATEKWVSQLTTNGNNNNVILLGQMVLGEILASPSAKQLDKIELILLDCKDQVRIDRLKSRNTYGANQDTLNWSAWLRVHCSIPSWEQHVIKDDCSPIMKFSRWDNLKEWDSIANIEIIDTTRLTIDSVAQTIASLIKTKSSFLNITPITKNDK